VLSLRSILFSSPEGSKLLLDSVSSCSSLPEAMKRVTNANNKNRKKPDNLSKNKQTNNPKNIVKRSSEHEMSIGQQ